MAIHNPHDTFFKEVFSDKEHVKELISLACPDNLTASFNWNTIQYENDTFIDEDMKKTQSDMLFSLNTKDKGHVKIYILIEHKSYKDNKTHVQLLSYISQIYSKMQKLHPVIPVIFYHGREKWDIVRHFHEVFFQQNTNNNCYEEFIEFIPGFKYWIINLHKYRHFTKTNSLTLKVIFFIFKNIWYFNDIEKLTEFINIAKELFYTKEGLNLLQKLFIYIFSTNEIDEKKVKEIISEKISYKKGDEIMTTTAERLINEGIEKGKLEGKLESRIELAEKMLTRGYEITEIADITGIPVQDILTLKDTLKP